LNIQDKFLRYVAYPTMSDDESESCPSTRKQLKLAEQLKKELIEMGITDARVDTNGYLYASVPATAEGYPTVGFIAHMDTALEMPDEPIRASVEVYRCGNLTLNAEEGIVMTEESFPCLKKYVGHRLVHTDGKTLLGADDKAGIAEIMVAAERLVKADFPHGRVVIGFTPDEEIGRGADRFDVEGFGADFAYTVDGGSLGELEYENFNAASAKVKVRGFAIHPGSAKGKMKNAARIAAEFDSLLPGDELPELTEGYEGFHHLLSISGETERAELSYIIRDHSKEKFAEKKEQFLRAAAALNEKYGEGTVDLTLTDSYYNMKEIIDGNMHTVELAKGAMLSLGIEPRIIPIRGGTDGARLSFMGLPCPNLSTGSENAHSAFEIASLDDMEKMAELLVEIIRLCPKG